MSFKRLVAGVFAAALLVPVAIAALPANASNKGDVWATNSPDAGAGHAHEPHLSCSTIYLHGSALADGGTYTIDSIPPSGSGLEVWSGTWSTPSSGDVIATVSGSDLVAAAVNLDNATPNVNQGYHFKLDLSQEGVKHKTFWVRCSEEPPTPTLEVTKTADKASVVSGDNIGITITAGPDEGSFADDVALSDPLPKAAGIDWFIDPAYTGPGTCTIGGSAPGQQTLHCSFGDLGAPENPVSATVHVASHTVAGTTAANGNITIDRALAGVDAKTAFGSVRVGEVVRGSVVLETGFGELELGVREGTAAWLDASSQHGSVRSDLDAIDSPEQADETVEVRARTRYGDIVVRRR